MYLFDDSFEVDAPGILDMYTVPPPFGAAPGAPGTTGTTGTTGITAATATARLNTRRDLLSLLDPEPGRFPFRWLVVGPTRGGTGLHVDPLGTAAWNTLLHGRKRWLVLPPGSRAAVNVNVNGDDAGDEGVGGECGDGDGDGGGGGEMASMEGMEGMEGRNDGEKGTHDTVRRRRSMNVCEAADMWFGEDVYGLFASLHDSAFSANSSSSTSSSSSPSLSRAVERWDPAAGATCFDFVQEAGETVFIPSGWAHAAIGLSPTIAVTHNFCSEANLSVVWREMEREKPEHAAAWRRRVGREFPDLGARLAGEMLV